MSTPTLANLRQAPLFAALRDDELESIAPLFAVRAYPKNAIVFSEGEHVSALFLILSGRTRHFWRDENGLEMDLVILGAGEWFGNVSLIGEPMVVSSITVEPLAVASISTKDMETLLLRYPALAVRFLKEHVSVI